MKYGIILTEKEIDNLEGILDMYCDNVECSVCPFNFKGKEESNCSLIEIKRKIVIALNKYKGVWEQC